MREEKPDQALRSRRQAGALPVQFDVVLALLVDCPEGCLVSLNIVPNDNAPRDAASKFPSGVYARDCGKRMTLGELIVELRKYPDSRQFCDKLDELFLVGAWGQELKDANFLMLRDIRGLIYTALHGGKS